MAFGRRYGLHQSTAISPIASNHPLTSPLGSRTSSSSGVIRSTACRLSQRFAVSRQRFLGPARQIFPRQLAVLPLEAGPGYQLGHFSLVTERQVEAADLLHSQRMAAIRAAQLRTSRPPTGSMTIEPVRSSLPRSGSMRLGSG
jgi:hypothetical protein